jgi:peptidoglycan-associated lipoprotein
MAGARRRSWPGPPGLESRATGKCARLRREEKVKQPKMKWITLVVALGAIMMLGACKKKVAPPPPPPPPPPAPTASLTANPNSIEKGQSTTLTWQTTNTTDASIDGIGAVQPNGSQPVTPSDSTTYHLTAKGPGGTQEATARVTVTAPAAPSAAPSATEEELFSQSVKDIFFDYDKYDIRADQQPGLQADIAFLKQNSGIRFTVEGHCDERGSTEYNLALGDNRANAVRNALTQAGIGPDRIKTISYGKEKPFCTQSNEECWQQNRRGHFVYQK